MDKLNTSQLSFNFHHLIFQDISHYVKKSIFMFRNSGENGIFQIKLFRKKQKYLIQVDPNGSINTYSVSSQKSIENLGDHKRWENQSGGVFCAPINIRIYLMFSHEIRLNVIYAWFVSQIWRQKKIMWMFENSFFVQIFITVCCFVPALEIIWLKYIGKMFRVINDMTGINYQDPKSEIANELTFSMRRNLDE